MYLSYHIPDILPVAGSASCKMHLKYKYFKIRSAFDKCPNSTSILLLITKWKPKKGASRHFSSLEKPIQIPFVAKVQKNSRPQTIGLSFGTMLHYTKYTTPTIRVQPTTRNIFLQHFFFIFKNETSQ